MDESADSFIVSGWLYGSIIGILLFGFIGDTLGYYKGMIISSSMSFIGILLRYISCVSDTMSAFSVFLPSEGIPFAFGLARILLGIGYGRYILF